MATKENSEAPWRTAQDTVFEVMAMFSESEPKAVFVIFTNEDGEMHIAANTGKCLALGMLETAKHMILTGEV